MAGVVFMLMPFCGLASIYSPEQVHISLSDSETSMTVTWAAENPSSASVVEFTPVTSPDQPISSFAYSAQGTWTTFPNQNISHILQRHLHTCKAVMTYLIPGNFYKYRVGSEIYGWSDVFTFEAKRNFTTNPLSRMLVYGDFGVGDQIYATMQRLIEETEAYKYDAIIHNGDFAYDLDSNQGQVGDEFMRSIEPVASKVPYMVSEGNHEHKYNIFHYNYRFSMPGNSSNLFYSFNIGKVHFIAYSTEFIFGYQSDLEAVQNNFIKVDLATYNRTLYPWLVVFGHRPLYCSANMTAPSVKLGAYFPPYERHNNDCLENATTVRNAFEETWYKAKVDLVITSHVHAYERLASVYKNESVPCETEDFNTCVNAKAPIYIVTGAPGQQESYAPVSPTPLPFSVFQDDHWGYSRMTVFNESHLLWEQVRSVTKEVIDFLWIIKQ